MEVIYTKTFLKQYQKLPQRIQEKVDERINLFTEQPSARMLNNHALQGAGRYYRSINVTGDYRALYKAEGNTVAIFVAIGTHSELYRT